MTSSRPSLVRAGFTLIETLLYVALAALILFTVVSFMITLLEARVKNQAIETVNREGSQVMAFITQTARNAISINAPTPGNDAASLSLTTGVAGNDPTVFSLSSGAILMTQGAHAAVPLTSSLVVVSNLQFRNLSKPSTPGNVDVSFTVEHTH